MSPGSTYNNGDNHNNCNNAALLSNYKENFFSGAQSTSQTLCHSFSEALRILPDASKDHSNQKAKFHISVFGFI